jgi:tetratricopeptide (TPR) repeat protein
MASAAAGSISRPAFSAVADDAMARCNAGDFAGALALLDRAHIDTAEAEAIRGWCLEHLSRPGDALAAYAEAVSADPDNLDAQLGLANVLAGLGQPAEARELWRGIVETIAMLPEPDAREFQLAGWSLYRLRELAGAEAAFRASLDRNPRGLAPAFDLALMLLHRGELDEAREIYERTAAEARARGALGAVQVALDHLRAAALPRALSSPLLKLL